MFGPEAGTEIPAAAAPKLHEELDPAFIRWMPVFVPFSGAIVVAMAATIWSLVL
jgi:hypothetical protein